MDADGWVTTAIHELVHALVFSSSLFRYFRNVDGTPKFARSPTDASVIASEVRWQCSPSTFTYPHHAGTRSFVNLAQGGIVDVFSERGLNSCPCPVNANKSGKAPNTMGAGCLGGRLTGGWRTPSCVIKMTTPKVIEKARHHFHCPTLQGAELENQDTTPCSIIGSHWEQRLFMNELMAPVKAGSVVTVVSEVTLAVFEDSGWYKPDYSMADKLTKGVDWGYKQGRNFALNQCVNAGHTNHPRHWCTTNSAKTCGLDRKGEAACTISPTTNVPAAVSYFSGAQVKGTLAQADYCPYYSTTISNRICTASSGSVPSPYSNVNYMREVFGAASRCFESTLHADVQAGAGAYVANSMDWNSSIPGCFEVVCSEDGRSYDVRISAVAGATTKLGTCTSAGQALVTGSLMGEVTCVDPAEICLSAAVMHYDVWISSAVVNPFAFGPAGLLVPTTTTTTTSTTTTNTTTTTRTYFTTTSSTTLTTVTTTTSTNTTFTTKTSTTNTTTTLTTTTSTTNLTTTTNTTTTTSTTSTSNTTSTTSSNTTTTTTLTTTNTTTTTTLCIPPKCTTTTTTTSTTTSNTTTTTTTLSTTVTSTNT